MAVVEVGIVDLQRSRGRLDHQRVAHYADHLDEEPPVTVFVIDGRLLLADGHHRVAAAERLGRTRVRADVRDGTRHDALEYAVEQVRRQRGITRAAALAAILGGPEPRGAAAARGESHGTGSAGVSGG